jgi:hypothetical protein
LLGDQLSVLGIFVELPQPLELLDPLFLSGQFLPLSLIKMELFGFVASAELYRIIRRKNLIADRPPSVILKALIPPIVLVVRVPIEMDVNCRLLLFLLDLHVITRSKGIDINH